MARVSVYSEGPGIAQQDLEHIWERFYRAQGVTVQHELELSMGLGLYICRVLIEYHHGQVGVQSDPGHGATFWFTVPVAEVPQLGSPPSISGLLADQASGERGGDSCPT